MPIVSILVVSLLISVIFAIVSPKKWRYVLAITFGIVSAETTLLLAAIFRDGDHDWLKWIGFSFVIGLISAIVASFALDKIRSLILRRGRVLQVGQLKMTVDYRVISAVCALLVAYAATALIAVIAFGEYRSNLIESLYASWTEDVLFFSIVGMAIAIISLRRPEHEHFITRIRYLFPTTMTYEKGPVIKFISEQLLKMGYILAHVDRTITIEEFNEHYDAYRVKVTLNHKMLNLFDDQECEDEGTLNVVVDKFEHHPPQFGFVTSIKLEGEAEAVQTPIEIGKDGIKENITIPVEEGAVKSLTIEYHVWMRAGEVQGAGPKRFAEKFSTRVVNKLTVGGHRPVVYLLDEEDQSGYRIQKVIARSAPSLMPGAMPAKPLRSRCSSMTY